MRALLLVLCALLLGSPALGANWYVDDDAAGGGDGSLATPFQTIQAGVTAAVSAGDSVLIFPGTYAENVGIGAGDNLVISGRSGDPSDVIWTPTGTTVSSTGIALVNTANGTTVVVEDLTFQNGSGLSTEQSGYTVTADDATHTLRNVVFNELNTCVWMYNTTGTTTTITIDGCTFQNPGATVASNAVSWAIQPRDAQLTVTNSTFNQVGESNWNAEAIITWAEDNSAGTIFRNCSFLGTNETGEVWIYNRAVLDDLLIEGCTFDGGNGVSTNDGLIKLSHVVTAAAVTTNAVIRYNTFSNFGNNAIRSPRPAAWTGAQMIRYLSIYGNTFYGNGSVTSGEENGIQLHAAAEVSIFNNKFYGSYATGAISLKACRWAVVSGNAIYNADNGVVVTANTTEANGIHAKGVMVVGNYFNGGAGDGAIKIDNYDGGTTAAAPQDSLFFVGGNAFEDVTVIGTWVNTSNTSIPLSVFSGYQATWPALSSDDLGQTIGDTDLGATDGSSPPAGSAIRPRPLAVGPPGPGVN